MGSHLPVTLEFLDDLLHARVAYPATHGLVIVLSKERLAQTVKVKEQHVPTFELLIEARRAKSGRMAHGEGDKPLHQIGAKGGRRPGEIRPSRVRRGSLLYVEASMIALTSPPGDSSDRG